MEFILDLAKQFWPMAVFIVLVILGFIINLFDKKIDNRVNFTYKDYPHMKPIRIATKGKGFWGALMLWVFGTRHWEVAKDFNYSINKQNFVIPKGFKFDGASVPKFLAQFLSPVGVLLIGGLIHDYGYKYETLLLKNGKTIGIKSQQWMDKTFRDINIEVNGFYFLNYLAYWALRIGGWVAWNKHRKVNAKVGEK
jgi:hypothetical protein|tara:strand:+ start:236 stop:820 length:585 start_codon:yes stop_codon:yes gene_type:complete